MYSEDLTILFVLVNVVTIITGFVLIKRYNTANSEAIERFLNNIENKHQRRFDDLISTTNTIAYNLTESLSNIEEQHDSLVGKVHSQLESMGQAMTRTLVQLSNNHQKHLKGLETQQKNFIQKQKGLLQDSVDSLEKTTLEITEDYQKYTRKVDESNQKLDALLIDMKKGIKQHEDLESEMGKSFVSLESVADRSRQLIVEYDKDMSNVKRQVKEFLEETQELLSTKSSAMESDVEIAFKKLVDDTKVLITSVTENANDQLKEYYTQPLFVQQKELLEHFQQQIESKEEISDEVRKAIVSNTDKLEKLIKAASENKKGKGWLG